MTQTKTKNLDRWIGRHHEQTFEDAFSLAVAVRADGLSPRNAEDRLFEREVFDYSASHLGEALRVHDHFDGNRNRFEAARANFNSWSALFEWVRCGADKDLLRLSKIAPITVDAIRIRTGVRPTRQPAAADARVGEVSDEALRIEMAKRVRIDPTLASTVLHDALQGVETTGIRESIREANDGFSVTAEMQELARQLSNLGLQIDRFGDNDARRQMAVRSFDEILEPAFSLLRLSVRGVSSVG